MRMMSMTSLILKSEKFGNIEITKKDLIDFVEPISTESNIDMPPLIPQELKNLCIPEEYDLDSISDNIWPSIVYIAGYASYSLLKKIRCDICDVNLKQDKDNVNIHNSSLISVNDRGGLNYPSESVVTITTYTYLTANNVLNNETVFLRQKDQRKIVIELTREVMNDLNLTLFPGHDCKEHSKSYLHKEIMVHICNILLKNYIKKQNDRTTTKSMPLLKRSKPVRKK